MPHPVLSSFLICTAVTLVALLLGERIASRLGLVDRPGGHKTHVSPTPVIGGLGMGIGLFLTGILTPEIAPGVWVAAGGIALILVGLWDDRHGMRARTKLFAQAAIVVAVFVGDGGLLRSLGSVLPGTELQLAVLALPVTVFALLGMINAVNMLDGLDGLAGKVMLVAFGWFALAAWLIGDFGHLSVTLAISGALSAFLAFNARLPGRSCARMFMGDTGSMLLGYLLTWTAIELTQRPGGLPPVAALWICALPIFDTTAVTAHRLATGRHPMSAGRDHLHHLLRAKGLSVGATASMEAAFGLIAGCVGFAGWQLGAPESVMFALFVLAAVIYGTAFHAEWKKPVPGRDPSTSRVLATTPREETRPTPSGAARPQQEQEQEQEHEAYRQRPVGSAQQTVGQAHAQTMAETKAEPV